MEVLLVFWALWELMIWMLQMSVMLVVWTFRVMAVLFDVCMWLVVAFLALLGVGAMAGHSAIQGRRPRARRRY